jgi:hypothetical protein
VLPFSPEDFIFSSTKAVTIRLYETVILLLVLYGCEIWSLTLGEEHGLRVFENRVLRRIFVLKTNEVTGGWKNLYNEELHNVYSLPGILRMISQRVLHGQGM